jgi:large-conductance mechanosensitive channel
MSAAHKQREREAESLSLYVFLVINWVFFFFVKTVNGTEREAKKEMGLLRERGNKVK